jgi:hypothetical protein
MGPPAHGSAQKKIRHPAAANGGLKVKTDQEKCATGNGSTKKRAKAMKQKRKGGKFAKKEVEKLPADFPKLQPSAVAVQARPTRDDVRR